MADNSLVAIKVEHVSKSFKLPHEKTTSIKSAVIGMVSHGTKGYELQQALQDISFEVKQGDFYAIVGRNGSGKSTLLKLLAGIYTPTSGTITVNGKLTPFIELGVGFNQDLSGRENVFLNGALLGFSRTEMEAMYDDIVSFAELGRFMDQKLKNYSSGMQVRLAFSIAIRAQSDILLLDEVLAVGDAAFQQKCFDYFEELKQQKKTVVFVSHDMGAVKRFCNKALYIKNGVQIHEGSPADVADMYALDNLESVKDNAKKDKKQTASNYSISTKIVDQTDTYVKMQADFKSKTDEDLYVAFSVIKDGATFAELTTPPDVKLVGTGRVIYTLDTTILNGGIYEIPTILCKKQNRELLSISSNKNHFAVKGSDQTRGAALKLPGTWSYE